MAIITDSTVEMRGHLRCRQVPVRERVGQVAGDEDRRQRVAPGVLAPGDDADRLDAGQVLLGQEPEHGVLPLRVGLQRLLERVHPVAVAHETDHVATRSLRHLDQPGEANCCPERVILSPSAMTVTPPGHD